MPKDGLGVISWNYYEYLISQLFLENMGTTNLNFSDKELKEKFYNLGTRADIAELLQVSEYQLRYHLYIFPLDKAYTTFKIPKKSGGNRSISAPKTSLKIIQRKLNQVLRCVYQLKPSTHGYALQKSIITNAKQHLRQRYVLNIDLKNFFPSINFGRVRGLFLATPYNCTEEVATVLAKICCHENQLPQGAPTSPIVSNMICARLDSQLQRLAKKHQCIYTRYADDITFSTSRSRFPKHLTWFSSEAEKLVIGDELKKAIEGNGFSINESKLRLQNRYQHQEVTGITVNEKLNINRKYIRQIRAVLHAWEKYGLENTEADFWKKYTKHHCLEIRPDTFRSVIKGRIEFVGAVRGKNDEIYIKFLKWLNKLAPDLVSDEKIFSLEKHRSNIPPVQDLPTATIWTEGKTDIKHLEYAFHQLKLHEQQFDLKLSFKDDLNDQRQGSDELIKMCEQYCKTKHINPVIAIFDRDEPRKIPKIHEESRGFKDWRNGVYSFALPIPKHRLEINDICIEHYYKDEEIQREDDNKRRLFLSSEFNPKTGRHKTNPELSTMIRIQDNQLKIIDSSVYKFDDTNVALSKNSFVDYIVSKSNNFNNFDFHEFSEIFKVIEKIVHLHFNRSEASSDTPDLEERSVI